MITDGQCSLMKIKTSIYMHCHEGKNERLSIFIYLLVVIYFKVKKKKILYMWNGSNIWIEEFLVPKSSTKECFLFTSINSTNL